MTDYNDGKWHGWNGGECPVHPESVVEIVYINRGASKFEEAIAKHCEFAKDAVMPIIAFRVIKEYKEPREFWIVLGKAFSNAKDAEVYAAFASAPITHVREVLK